MSAELAEATGCTPAAIGPPKWGFPINTHSQINRPRRTNGDTLARSRESKKWKDPFILLTKRPSDRMMFNQPSKNTTR